MDVTFVGKFFSAVEKKIRRADGMGNSYRKCFSKVNMWSRSSISSCNRVDFFPYEGFFSQNKIISLKPENESVRFSLRKYQHFDSQAISIRARFLCFLFSLNSLRFSLI